MIQLSELGTKVVLINFLSLMFVEIIFAKSKSSLAPNLFSSDSSACTH